MLQLSISSIPTPQGTRTQNWIPIVKDVDEDGNVLAEPYAIEFDQEFCVLDEKTGAVHTEWRTLPFPKRSDMIALKKQQQEELEKAKALSQEQPKEELNPTSKEA